MMHLPLFMTWDRLATALQLRAGSVLHDGEVSAGLAKAHLRLILRKDVDISSEGDELVAEAAVRVALQPREQSLFSGEWIRDRVSVQFDFLARFYTRIEWQPDWSLVSFTRWQLDRETEPTGILDKSAMAVLRNLADAQMDTLAAQVDQTIAALPVEESLREAWSLVFQPIGLDIDGPASLSLRPVPESLQVSPVYFSEGKGDLRLRIDLQPRLTIGEAQKPAIVLPAFPVCHPTELAAAPTCIEAEVCLSYQRIAQRIAGLSVSDEYGHYALGVCHVSGDKGRLRAEANTTVTLKRWPGPGFSGRLGVQMEVCVREGLPQVTLRNLYVISGNLALRAGVLLARRTSLPAMEEAINQAIKQEWNKAQQQTILTLRELTPVPGFTLRCTISSLSLLACTAEAEGILAKVRIEGQADAELDPAAFYR